MQLSKFSYYSDFVVYPITVIALTAVNFRPVYLAWRRGMARRLPGGLGAVDVAGVCPAPHRTASHAGFLAHAQPASR